MRAGLTAGIKGSARYPVSPSHPPTDLGSGVLQIYVKCLAAMICGDTSQAPAAQHAIRNGVGVAEPPSSAANGQFVDVVGQESVAILKEVVAVLAPKIQGVLRGATLILDILKLVRPVVFSPKTQTLRELLLDLKLKLVEVGCSRGRVVIDAAPGLQGP